MPIKKMKLQLQDTQKFTVQSSSPHIGKFYAGGLAEKKSAPQAMASVLHGTYKTLLLSPNHNAFGAYFFLAHTPSTKKPIGSTINCIINFAFNKCLVTGTASQHV
ncbi:MAG: hypothetical protein Ta2G_18360 [Termitinemataceae bacterium]|nr:MAG: hypothetical protein Ta2G_18360 [Termitinemataceae bacterium]